MGLEGLLRWPCDHVVMGCEFLCRACLCEGLVQHLHALSQSPHDAGRTRQRKARNAGREAGSVWEPSPGIPQARPHLTRSDMMWRGCTCMAEARPGRGYHGPENAVADRRGGRFSVVSSSARFFPWPATTFSPERWSMLKGETTILGLSRHTAIPQSSVWHQTAQATSRRLVLSCPLGSVLTTAALTRCRTGRPLQSQTW
jgi:hypothetical protein